MHRSVLLLIVVSLFLSFSIAQTSSPATPPPAAPHQHGDMADMHKQHMDAMKADLDKMKASLEQMKTNVAGVTDPAEKARWQSNIDLWTAMIGHMEQMMTHMEHMGGMGMMGSGMHHDHTAPPPSDDKKPQ
jgi:hypothetical protein